MTRMLGGFAPEVEPDTAHYRRGIDAHFLVNTAPVNQSGSWVMNIDLGKVVSMVGEETIGEIGAPLGLSKDLSMKAATALASNFTGNKDQAIDAAARETGLGKEVLEAMLAKLISRGKDMAVDAVKDEGAKLAKGMFGKFFGG
jgi:hypothetical protein